MYRRKHVVTSAFVAGLTAVGAIAAGAAMDAGATAPPDTTTAPTEAPASTTPATTPVETEAPASTAPPGTETPTPPTESTDEGDRTISVGGHGTVSVTPDVADIYMGVLARATTSQEALDLLEEKSNALVTTLTAVGVAEEDIQTAGLSLYPTTGEDGAITGYEASTNVTVTVRDVARVGEIVDATANLVGPELTLGGISFRASDPEAALEEARVEAIENARTRAEQYAAAAGLGVGEVLHIVESGTADVPVFRGEVAQDAAAASVAIEPGQQELTVDITVVFELR